MDASQLGDVPPQASNYWTLLAALVPGTIALVAMWFKENKKDAREARNASDQKSLAAANRFTSLENGLRESERARELQKHAYDTDRQNWNMERMNLIGQVAELRGQLQAFVNDKDNQERIESELRGEIAQLRGELSAYERFGRYEKRPGGRRQDDPNPPSGPTMPRIKAPK